MTDQKHITPAEVNRIAKAYEVDPKVLAAVMEVEGSGHGFDPATGKIIIQFEPHWFKRFSDHTVTNGVEGQATEWRAFNKAWAINKKAAMLSTSWGIMQVMGFNHPLCGYEEVGQMVDAFKMGEVMQLDGAMRFIANNSRMHEALQKLDFETFAYYYNGPGYAKYRYNHRLREAYERQK